MRCPGYEMIVSADGTDGTREIAADLGADDPRFTVIGGPERRGKGRGIRHGVALASGGVVGFVDADDKTPIEEIEKLVPWLDRGYDVVIGSRGLADSRVEVSAALVSPVGSRGFGLGMHLLLGLRHVRDTQCGFKFFRAAVAPRSVRPAAHRRLHVRRRGAAPRGAALGYRVKEVGVRWRDDGDSRSRAGGREWPQPRRPLPHPVRGAMRPPCGSCGASAADLVGVSPRSRASDLGTHCGSGRGLFGR